MQSASPPLEAAEGRPAVPGRAGRTGRDMAISLVVLLIPLALVVAIFRLRGGEDTVVVDPSTAIESAQRADLFPVLAPTGLPDGWRTLSAQFTRDGATGELRVGYLTPDDGPVQLIESNEDAASLSDREFAGRAELTGTTNVAGGAWQAYRVRGDDRALVLTGPGRSVIIIGSAAAAELEALATSLR